MSSGRVKELATLLFERRGEAVVVPHVERIIARWKPEEHQTTSGGRVNCVTFQARSVLEENGVLVDITPTRASRRYPFIRHEGGEKDFIEFVESGDVD